MSLQKLTHWLSVGWWGLETEWVGVGSTYLMSGYGSLQTELAGVGDHLWGGQDNSKVVDFPLTFYLKPEVLYGLLQMVSKPNQHECEPIWVMIMRSNEDVVLCERRRFLHVGLWYKIVYVGRFKKKMMRQPILSKWIYFFRNTFRENYKVKMFELKEWVKHGKISNGVCKMYKQIFSSFEKLAL